jgi:hypothetical protein
VLSRNEAAMGPARIIAAVLLTAGAGAAGSYIAYSSNRPSAAAPTPSITTVAPTTTAGPITRVTTSTPGPRPAACTSEALLPLLKRRLDNPSSELTIVRADVKRCRNGYAHVFAIPRTNPAGHPRYDAEQLFLRQVNGSWQSVAEGTGIACTDSGISTALLRACRALDYPTHITAPAPPLTPRFSDPALAADYLFDAWQAGDRQRALQVASPATVHALLAIGPTPRPRFSGCRSRDLGFQCVYSYPDANGVLAIDMRVEGGASAGYRVVAIDALLRFADPQSSAKHLLDAWLAGDRAEARKAATATAVDAMFRLGDRFRPPSFTGCTSAASASTVHTPSMAARSPCASPAARPSAGWSRRSVRFAPSPPPPDPQPDGLR